MKKQFKANLPRSKQQIKDSISKYWNDENWLEKVKRDKKEGKEVRKVIKRSNQRTQSQANERDLNMS